MNTRQFRIAVGSKLGAAFLTIAVVAMDCLVGAQAQVTKSIFGPNVTVIPAGTSETAIETALTNLSNYTEFDTNRAAVLFQPGTYTVQAPIGYYESIAGLGQNPNGVTINGFITPNFGTWTTWNQGNGPGTPITTYFWRSMENMSIVAATDSAQGGGTNQLQWGVSQGDSFRRMNVTGDLELTDSYCGTASGGFIADSAISGTVTSCSQQQWFTRNSSYGGWAGGVWNMVFSGVTGAPTPNYPANSYTVLSTTPVSREKPYLYVDGSGNYFVFSPSVQASSSGTTWGATTNTAGTSLAISTFLIATPTTPLATINTWLQTAGQNLILTPGIYQYSGAIAVTQANTVVLGMGYATLVPQTGTPALTVADVDGVQIADLLIDAGPTNSPVLLEVGSGANTGVRHNANPTSISDVFFRIGGSTLGTATVTLQVDSDDVILDNIWAWRADHGNAGTTGWTVNTAANGLVVNGDYVTALGLAVEHYQAAQVQWNGNYGETIFYQSEDPYDPPSQSAWMDGAMNGYPSYNVASGVTNHTTYGMGVYSYFNQGVAITQDQAINVPNAVGVTATDSVSVFLNGSGQITSTIDNAGTTVKNGTITSYVPFYQGVACTSTCPNAPSALTATFSYQNNSQAGQVSLSWTSGTTANANYTIYRDTTAGFTPSVSNQLVAGLTSATTTYTDTSISAGSNYYYVVEAQTLGGTAFSNYAGIYSPASGGVITSDVIAINANGPAIAGTDWIADTDYIGGGSENPDGNTITIPSGMANAAPQAVYNTMRNGTPTYAIPNLTPGASYIVDLHFNEDYFTTPGQRVFDVAINGTPVLSNFDIEAAAGGAHIANIQSFNETADNTGTITIAITSVKNNPLISGIEIGTGTPYGAPTGPNPPGPATALSAVAISAQQVNLSWAASVNTGVTYSVFRGSSAGFTTAGNTALVTGLTGTSYTDTTVSATTTYYYIVQTVSADGQSTRDSSVASATTPYAGGVITQDVLDIDAGYDAASVPGAAPFAGNYGANWQLDTSTTAGSAPAQDNNLIVIPQGTVNAAPEYVYQWNRSGPATWVLPGFTPNATYIVDLHFEESWFTTPQQREFNVSINGVQVLTNFDIEAVTGGHHIANVQSFAVQADGSGNITVATSNGAINTPLICGIEVGTGNVGVIPSAPASLTATPASDSEIDLSWPASTTANVTYSVYASTTSGFTPGASNLLQAGITGTTYNNTGLAANTTYYYTVEAVNSLASSPGVSNSAVTLPVPCTTLPSVPAALMATAASDTEVDISWAPSTAVAGCTITYNVYRGTASGFTPTTPLNGTGLYPASYQDTGLTASTTYYYVVEASDAAGSSAASTQGSATTLASGNSTWTLTWGDDFNGAAGTTYDHTKWTNEVAVNTNNQWGDGTIQSTSDSLQNVYLDGNGHLVEAMTYNAAPGAGQTAYTSARLHSVENISYGKIEASIQNPSAPGMGAAFWALGTDIGTVGWPKSGELDMMELQASNPAHNGSTIHGYETDGGTNYEYGGISATMDLPAGEPNFDQAFHTITTLWGPYHVQYFMDGVQYGDVNLANLGATDIWPLMGPSDNYTINLILSSGIGGNGGTPGTVGFPSNYTFDYVHYSTLTAGLPNAVSGLTASQTYSNAVQLNWTASTTAGVTYNIYASTTQGAKLDLSTLVEQNASSTSLLVSALNPATTYYFTVLASNWGGEAAVTSGDAVTATTVAAGNGTSVLLSAGGYAVGGYMNSQFVTGGNTNYHLGNVVDLSQVVNPAPAEVYTTERWGPASWSIPNLTPGGSYNVRLHFVEAAHTAAGQRAFNVAINGATVLTNFDIYATAGGKNKAVTQTFTAIADGNGDIGIQTLMGTSNAVDQNPTISAIDVTPQLVAPAVPTNLIASVGSTSEIDLTWNASTSSGVQYLVFRSTTSGFTPSASNQITASPISATAYADTGLTASTTYYYVVEATDNGGTSGPSNQAAATTDAGSVSVPGFTLTFSLPSLTLTLGTNGTDTLTLTPINGFTPTTNVSFSCFGLPSGSTCSFSPTTVNSSGNMVSTLTITTTTSSAKLRGSGLPFLPGSLPGSALALSACLLGISSGWRKRRGLHRMLMLLVLGIVSFGALTGCGGGTPSKSSVGSTPTTGTSTVAVVARSGIVNQVATFTLTTK